MATMLGDSLSATGTAEALDAARLYIVTCALTMELCTRLLSLRSVRREVAVVWVDAPSFAGVTRAPGAADAAALRLAQSGVDVAHLAAGDDVAGALSSAVRRRAGVG